MVKGLLLLFALSSNAFSHGLEVFNPAVNGSAISPTTLVVGPSGSSLDDESVLTSSGNVVINSTSPVAENGVFVINEQGGATILAVRERGALEINLSTPSYESVLTSSGSVIIHSTSPIQATNVLRINNNYGAPIAAFTQSGRLGIGISTPAYLIDTSDSDTGGDGGCFGNACAVNRITSGGQAAFAHREMVSNGSGMAILQLSGGDTYLNSPGGKITLRSIDLVEVARTDSVGETITGTFGVNDVTRDATVDITGRSADAFTLRVSSADATDMLLVSHNGSVIAVATTTLNVAKIVGSASNQFTLRITSQNTTTDLLLVNSNGSIVAVATLTITGVTDGTDAMAGKVGEFLSAQLGGAFTPVDATFVSIATISLTAGDWDVSAMCAAASGGTTVSTERYCAISATANGTDAGAYTGVAANTMTVSKNEHTSIMQRRVNVTSTTDYYLTARIAASTIGGFTWTTNSIISARRVR